MSTKKSVKKSKAVRKTAATPKRKAPASAAKRKPVKPAAAPQRAPAAKRAAASAAPLRSNADFMAHAYAMEAEAAERYAEFADSMEMHNNREVAELFRKLARIEQIHADQILEQMGWKQSPLSSVNVRWEGMEGPETADPTELHYLMQPYHALQIALLNEKRARDFFANLAKLTKDAGVRKGALEMEEDEAEHVRLIEQWLKRTPKPDPNWETDQDPPVLSD
ncbi:MAG: ferritin family protein [Pseudomonadota bacterium]|mgnify:CR=1 FL=1